MEENNKIKKETRGIDYFILNATDTKKKERQSRIFLWTGVGAFTIALILFMYLLYTSF